jgi:hypothetical protein
MTIEWANRGINLWTIEECVIPLVTNQGVYPVPADTIDILDLVTRTSNGSTSNQTDINLSRISESTYSTIPNKLTTGRPIQVWFNRQTAQTNGLATTTVASTGTVPPVSTTATTITLTSVAGLGSTGFVKIDSETIGYTNIDTSTNQLLNCWRAQNGTTAATHSAGASVYIQNLPCVNVWPTPDAGGGPYVLVYWRMRRLQDAGDGVNVQDIPFRFINCFVAGLSYMLSVKLPNMDVQRVLGLKQDYEEQFNLAAQEDRETAPLRWVPRNLFYSR